MNRTHIRDSFKWNSSKKFGWREPANTATRFTGSLLGTMDWGKRWNMIFIPWSVWAFVRISASCLLGWEKEARQLEKSNMINTGTLLCGRCHYLLTQNGTFVSLCCSTKHNVCVQHYSAPLILLWATTGTWASLIYLVKMLQTFFSYGGHWNLTTAGLRAFVRAEECYISGGKPSSRRAGGQSSPTMPDP